MNPDTAEEILAFPENFGRVTCRHVLFTRMRDTGFSIETARTPTLDDYHVDGLYVEVHHRRKRGTPLENKTAERDINHHGWTCEVVDDYLRMHRHDVETDEGRESLLTSTYGRPVDSDLRQHIKALTRPCHYSDHSRISVMNPPATPRRITT